MTKPIESALEKFGVLLDWAFKHGADKAYVEQLRESQLEALKLVKKLPAGGNFEYQLLTESIPNAYIADVEAAGDVGIFQEVSVSIFHVADRSECLADVLVGISPNGEPRVLVTTDSRGYEHHPIALYPLRPKDSVVEVD